MRVSELLGFYYEKCSSLKILTFVGLSLLNEFSVNHPMSSKLCVSAPHLPPLQRPSTHNCLVRRGLWASKCLIHSFPASLTSSATWTIAVVAAIQSLSHVWLCEPMNTARQASLSFTISWSLLKLMSIDSMMPSNHVILCHPLLPSIFPSTRVFQWVGSWLQVVSIEASTLVFPMNIQCWFPLGLTSLTAVE